jgi:hypothetical protein
MSLQRGHSFRPCWTGVSVNVDSHFAQREKPVHIIPKPVSTFLRNHCPQTNETAVQLGLRSAAKGQELITDWKRTAIVLALIAGVLILALFVTKVVFKLWALAICVAGGIAGAYFAGGQIAALLSPHLPANVPPNVVGLLGGFLAGYIIGTLLLTILLKPFRKAKGA